MGNSVSTTALVLLAVLPVIAGAALTALFNLLAQRRLDNRDHERWLKESRYQAFSGYVVAARKWDTAIRLKYPDLNPTELQGTYSDAYCKALMLADESTRTNIQSFAWEYTKNLASTDRDGARRTTALAVLEVQLARYVIEKSPRPGFNNEEAFATKVACEAPQDPLFQPVSPHCGDEPQA